MSTWASIAKTEPPKPAPVVVVEKVRPSVAVIDANAIISGTGLLNLMASTEKVVTIPEVLREVRDQQSRAALAALPFTIHTQEPTEESVKAGTLSNAHSTSLCISQMSARSGLLFSRSIPQSCT